MTTLIQVQDDTSLARDKATGAVLMVNSNQHKAYVEQRQRIIERNNEIKRQGEEINNLKNDISDIKGMLTALLNRNQQ